MSRHRPGRLFVLLLLNFAVSGISAAEPVPMDWSQFKVDPEPATAPTLREKLQAHLARVDRCLTELRAVGRRPNQTWPADRLSPTECFARLDHAWAFVGTPSHVPGLVSDMGSTDELLANLARAKEIAQKAQDGDKLTPEMSGVLQAAHGLVKSIRRQLTKIPAAAEAESVAGTESSQQQKRRRTALIVRPTADLQPVQLHLEYPIGIVLWQLSTLTAAQRLAFMKSILEDDVTRLQELVVEPEPKSGSRPLLMLLAKDIEMPDVGLRTVQLPFKTTFERRGTESFRQILRILSNTSTEAELTVRSTLLCEIPVTNDLSITSCETVMTFRPAGDEEHRGQTVVTFSSDMELTFYGRLSSRLRDVSFRSVAVSKSEKSMERSNERGAGKTCDELNRLLVSTFNQTSDSKILFK